MDNPTWEFQPRGVMPRSHGRSPARILAVPGSRRRREDLFCSTDPRVRLGSILGKCLGNGRSETGTHFLPSLKSTRRARSVSC